MGRVKRNRHKPNVSRSQKLQPVPEIVGRAERDKYVVNVFYVRMLGILAGLKNKNAPSGPKKSKGFRFRVQTESVF